jgi:hypothetical protein
MKMRGFIVLFVVACGIVYLLWMAKIGKEKTIKEVKAYDQTQVELTKVNMAALQQAIVTFIAQEGRTPENLKEAQRIHSFATANLDAWGTAIKYERVSSDNFRLTSAGRDKAFGTSDDIVINY